ncbi:aggregation-promoting factor C-terminal-like domain-containing protein [Ornithinimicrobium sediminis]|uniref:aggregation-promoting factor C-terminal-like domain-containing protein n=1 Tax=Ornithinimicrobium sediminis TaxID=2904603 RepID=UPI001E57817F|nr:hypothetical protein [Ornithinimicrobium sediminis]MCE0485619.1 hypothetical protein [Ornithinimicrobium sediminis]
MTRSTLPGSVEPDTTTLDRAESGRHRHGVRRHPATMVTAAIAVGSVALAGFAATGATADSDAGRVQASLNGTAPAVADSAVSAVKDSARRQAADRGSLRIDRISDQYAALNASRTAASESARAANEAAEAIAQERKAEKEAAERAAAEEAAAERAAAEEAAAERAAAEEAAAEQAAAARETEQAAAEPQEQAASRSAEREPAPSEPAPAPAPSGDPRSIARSMLSSYGWGQDQFGCLDSLWIKESGWNHTAQNPSSGAYGIPQSLPGSKMASAGADWQTNPATQIRWGLGYIDGRYGSPCAAWSHSQAHNWY